MCLTLNRKKNKDKNRYFGPYPCVSAARNTVEVINRIYPLRKCNHMGKDVCLYYHIGQCKGPCQGYISKEDYRENINKAIKFLEGNYTLTIKELEEKMQEASANLDFEKAMECRDLINSINHVAGNQKITTHQFEDRDIIAYAEEGNDAVVQVFFIREGKLLGRDHFHMSVAEGDGKSEIISQFMKQYYGGTPYIPNVIMIQEEIDDSDIIADWLSKIKKRKVSVVTPKKGDKEKLVELAYKNARMVLIQDGEKIKREQQRTTGAMEEIAGWLNIPNIRRAEAYDISNTNGIESVGSMVVFEDGRPKKNDYRKFKIKTVKGPDDYKSMREVLTRRFTRGMRERAGEEETRGFAVYPDLIMMDGGRGQVNIALEVLDELHINIPVCGMVKDDNHNTRGLYYNNVEIPIDRHSEGFKLITRVQDEAHRFAIEYHRSLRSKKQVSSVLDEIEGIGPARRKALMKHFLDIDKIRNANVSELMEAEGITENVAQNIYKYFH